MSSPAPAPSFTPDQVREFRTWVEKDLAHVENLFTATKAALRNGDLRLAEQFMTSVADEAAAMRTRLIDRAGGQHAASDV
jgi:hypothetical protein